MKAKLLNDVTLTALSGSVVNVTEDQLKALGDKAVLLDESENAEEVQEEEKPAKKTAKSKK